MRKTIITAISALCLSFLFLSASAQAQKGDSPSTNASSDTAKNATAEKIFNEVEVEASVDVFQWRAHLGKNLMAPIEKAAKKGMKAGQYTVNVRFLVERDGSISDVKALNDPGYGLADASVNVVRTGPKWKAGEQNGRKVRSYHTQPLTFVIQEK
jgi:periplasmic protein TonB